MHKNISHLFFFCISAEVQRKHMKFDIRNAIGDFFQRDFSAANMRIIRERENKNSFHLMHHQAVGLQKYKRSAGENHRTQKTKGPWGLENIIGTRLRRRLR